MKKSLLPLITLVMTMGIFGFVNADRLDISELFQGGIAQRDDAYSLVLNDYESERGYVSDAIKLECTSKDTTVTIVSPLAIEGTDAYLTTYRLFISPYRREQLKSLDSFVDKSKIIIKEQEVRDNDSEVKFEISKADIDSNTAYYGFILPIGDIDTVGTPSKEVCFQLANNLCSLDSDCDKLDSTIKAMEDKRKEEEHGASCVGMDMANVTHTINGSTLTLKWTAVEGDTVDIAIWDVDMYKSLGSARMRDEKFDYQIQWDGEQNFVLDNGCGQVKYKADAKKVDTPTKVEEEKEPIVTPTTGPAENMLYIAIAAIILYGVYTVFFRRSDD